MPAKRKTTAQTKAALQRLFAARDKWERNLRVTPPPSGMELTPGFTLGGARREYRNPEPRVWVMRRRVRIPSTVRMQDADPLVTALWDTLPKDERRRSRLFAHCPACPVRFTKRGAIADAYRCGKVGRYTPPSRKEQMSAEVRASIEPPRLDPQNDFEEGVARVWDELSTLHRRTLYAWLRPATPHREWALEGAPSPEAFASRVRTAERAVARALAPRAFPDVDYSIKTRGRRGFDYERFWDDYLSVGQMP
jgi:hypothetical protein